MRRARQVNISRWCCGQVALRCKARWLSFLLSGLLFCLIANAQSLGSEEVKIKAALLVNFAKFTVWPGLDPAGAELWFCTYRAPAIHNYLDTQVGRPIGQRTLQLKALDSVTEVQQCNVLFVGEAVAGKEQQQLIEQVEQGLLLVGESADFAKKGGVIGFVRWDDRVRFEINTAAAARRSLVIKAALLDISARLYQ